MKDADRYRGERVRIVVDLWVVHDVCLFDGSSMSAKHKQQITEAREEFLFSGRAVVRDSLVRAAGDGVERQKARRIERRNEAHQDKEAVVPERRQEREQRKHSAADDRIRARRQRFVEQIQV